MRLIDSDALASRLEHLPSEPIAAHELAWLPNPRRKSLCRTLL